MKVTVENDPEWEQSLFAEKIAQLLASSAKDCPDLVVIDDPGYDGSFPYHYVNLYRKKRRWFETKKILASMDVTYGPFLVTVDSFSAEGERYILGLRKGLEDLGVEEIDIKRIGYTSLDD